MTDPFERLGEAIDKDDLAAARLILQEHPELKTRLGDAIPGGAFGSVAIQGAVRHGNREMIDVLLAAGASIHGRSHWWAGSFGVFDDAKDEAMVAFLLSRGAVMDPHDAAKWGRLDVLEKLVAKDPNAVHFRGGDGQTPLHVAATVEIATFLLGHGADIDALDVDHESTPAQYLIRDHPDVVRFLMERGCKTDIMMAAALRDLALIRRILDQDPGAIRTTVSEEYFPMKNPKAGGTIYNWTLERYITVIQAVYQGMKYDRQPLGTFKEVFDLLHERAPDELRLVDACQRQDFAQARALIAANPDLPRSLSKGAVRQLPYAAQFNENTNWVPTMLEFGWPVDARGQHEATALHWASFHGNVATVKLLLDHGARTDLEDADFGGTPLGWARYGETNSWLAAKGDYPATIELLERSGGSDRIIQ